ncbi:MAG: hypothetical protein GYA24_11365 [Candidatus Lokiarchaeota archaeon]|nr:hypothetical protein [Candidatus Lokiarchaeota archaeon]
MDCELFGVAGDGTYLYTTGSITNHLDDNSNMTYGYDVTVLLVSFAFFVIAWRQWHKKHRSMKDDG